MKYKNFNKLEKIQLTSIFGGQEPVGHVKTSGSSGTTFQVGELFLPDTKEFNDSYPICC